MAQGLKAAIEAYPKASNTDKAGIFANILRVTMTHGYYNGSSQQTLRSHFVLL